MILYLILLLLSILVSVVDPVPAEPSAILRPNAPVAWPAQQNIKQQVVRSHSNFIPQPSPQKQQSQPSPVFQQSPQLFPQTPGLPQYPQQQQSQPPQLFQQTPGLPQYSQQQQSQPSPVFQQSPQLFQQTPGLPQYAQQQQSQPPQLFQQTPGLPQYPQQQQSQPSPVFQQSPQLFQQTPGFPQYPQQQPVFGYRDPLMLPQQPVTVQALQIRRPSETESESQFKKLRPSFRENIGAYVDPEIKPFEFEPRMTMDASGLGRDLYQLPNAAAVETTTAESAAKKGLSDCTTMEAAVVIHILYGYVQAERDRILDAIDPKRHDVPQSARGYY